MITSPKATASCSCSSLCATNGRKTWGPARSALIMENFETPESAEPLIARLEIVGRHATSALYNAAEMKRIPLGWLWRPIVKVQDGLGGKTKAWLTIGGIALAIGILAMIVVPYPH